MTLEILLNRIRFDINNSFNLVNHWLDEGHGFLNHRPASGGWTGREILEHIMLTNGFLLIIIEKGTAKALRKAATEKVIIDWEQYAHEHKDLWEIGVHKSFQWDRPDHMEPQHKVSLAEIRSTLLTQKVTCLNCLELLRNGEGVLHKTTMTVNNLGKLNVYEYIEFLTQHMIRHLMQLANNKKEFEMKAWAIN